MPGRNVPNTPEFTAPLVPAEYDFLIPEVYAEYCRVLPDFVVQFSDEQLVGRANNLRYETPLRQFEDGHVSHRIVHGMFEPHIRNLVGSEALLHQRRTIFDRLLVDGVEPVEAEKQATRATNLMAIPMVEKAHDPVVQTEIRKELLYRSDIAVTGAQAGFERFKEVLAQYKSTDVQYPWEASKELFARFQAQGRRVHPEARGRHFDLMVALGSAAPDIRPFIAEIDGSRVSTTLHEAKMRLVFAWHKQEVAASMRIGRKLDLVRIREKFEPLYDKLGYEYQDPSLSVQPSRVREGVIVTGLALKAGTQAVGHGVESAARVTTANVEQVTRVGSAGILSLGLLAPLAAHPANLPERPAVSTSQLVDANKLPTIDLNTGNTAFSSMPTAFEMSAPMQTGETCADPFKYTSTMKKAVDRLIARGGNWGRQGVVLDYFLSHCEGINASAGIVGNTQAESGTNPTRHQLHGTGYGTFQHDGSRKQQLMSIPGYQKLSTQLDFAWNEMKQGGMVDNLQRATSPEEGAVIFEQLFERAGVKRFSVRKGYARDIYDEYLKEYRIVAGSNSHAPAPQHAAPTPQHAAPRPQPNRPAQVAPPSLNFSSAISEALPGVGGAINPADHFANQEENAAVKAHTAELMTGIEQALASNTPTSGDVILPVDTTVAPLDRSTPDVSRSNTRPAIDFTSEIQKAIATREAFTAIPAALTTEAPADNSTPLTPEHAAASIALQAALAAPIPTHVEQAPLPPASSALGMPATPQLPDLQPQPALPPVSPLPPVTALPDISGTSAIHPATPDTTAPGSSDVILPPATVTPPQSTTPVDLSPSLLDSLPVPAPSVVPNTQPSLVDSLPSSPAVPAPQPETGLIDAAPALPDISLAPPSPAAPATPIIPTPQPQPSTPNVPAAPQAPNVPAPQAQPNRNQTPETSAKGTKADYAQQLGISTQDILPSKEGMYLSKDAYDKLGFDKIRKEYRKQYPTDHKADKNGMYTGQCVSWTGFRVDNDKFPRLMPNWGGRGDAYEWIYNAQSAGIPVDRTPAVGAAMEWKKSPGHSSAGHSAYVEKVFDDGSVLITEYNNIGPSLPSARVITADEIANNPAIRFLHFEK